MVEAQKDKVAILRWNGQIFNLRGYYAEICKVTFKVLFITAKLEQWEVQNGSRAQYLWLVMSRLIVPANVIAAERNMKRLTSFEYRSNFFLFKLSFW